MFSWSLLILIGFLKFLHPPTNLLQKTHNSSHTKPRASRCQWHLLYIQWLLLGGPRILIRNPNVFVMSCTTRIPNKRFTWLCRPKSGALIIYKLFFNSFLLQPKTCWKWMLSEMVCEKGYSIFGGQEILHDSQGVKSIIHPPKWMALILFNT